ncbi:unnamed protein product [Effrenium voratum]|nr:unnamed protein product [Effrenium voratum]
MCFLNAILQSMYFTPMLRRNLALACESVVVKDEWLIALRQLFAELDSSRTSKACVAATRMASLIQAASTNGEFQHGEQADAHEAFMLLISKLLEGCIAARGLSVTEKEQIEQSSLIGHIFGMSLSQSVSCKTCGDKSVRSRAEYCFCVTCPVDAGGRHRKIDVKDLLMTYTQEEHINEWKCDKCFHPGCVRQAGIAHPPNILMVHISRPQQGWTSQVTFERELAIQCDAASYRKMRYLIYAVIVYRSMGTNGGHYFAFVRSGRGQSEQWYLADDDEIRSVSWAEVQREEPFMLLYEARKVIPPIATDSEQRLLEEERLQQARLEEEARAQEALQMRKAEAAEVACRQVEPPTARQLEKQRRLEKEEVLAKKLHEHEDPYTPATELSSTTAGSEGRSRQEDHPWPARLRTERAMEFNRWSIFHSCHCSLPPAEFSDGLEDDALHCM